jgi:hypothetical protein
VVAHCDGGRRSHIRRATYHGGQGMRKPVPEKWTVTDVADRFEEAAYTLKRLPPVKVQGFFSTWPPIVRTVAEQLAEERLPMRLGPPSAEAVARMEETIQ